MCEESRKRQNKTKVSFILPLKLHCQTYAGSGWSNIGQNIYLKFSISGVHNRNTFRMCGKHPKIISNEQSERVITHPVNTVAEHAKSNKRGECISSRTNPFYIGIIFRNNNDCCDRCTNMSGWICVELRNPSMIINLIWQNFPYSERRRTDKRAFAAAQMFEHLYYRSGRQHCLHNLTARA